MTYIRWSLHAIWRARQRLPGESCTEILQASKRVPAWMTAFMARRIQPGSTILLHPSGARLILRDRTIVTVLPPHRGRAILARLLEST